MEIRNINNKFYTELFEEHVSRFSFYHSAPWFLGLAKTPKILACYDQEEVIAAWPFDTIKRLYFIKCLSQPTFVSNLGPIFLMDESQFSSNYSLEKFQHKVIDLFLDHLEDLKIDCIQQDLFFNFSAPHLMKFRKYQLTYKHSYYLPKALTEKEIWEGMSRGHRYKIRKMESNYLVESTDNYRHFYETLRLTFNRIRIKNLVSEERLIASISEVVKNNKGVLLCVKDQSGSPLSYGFFGWDANRMYYAIGANDVNRSQHTLSILLLWKAIQRSREMNLDFDFEGTMIKELDSQYAGFGSRRDIYVNIFRTRKLFNRILFNLNELRRS